ncbi:MAG: arsenic efflux protein [Bacteroidales bacterium]|nr:arsenic efflux protein [Bacteroidales bacterium]
MLYEFVMDVVVQTVLITFFVLSMLVLLEYVNVRTSGRSNDFVNRHSNWQIFIATIMGLIPGCVGSYAAVSLYTHNVIGLGALVANLIATTGEDGWMMIGLMPGKAFLIFGILFLLSMGAGYAVDFFSHHRNKCGQETHFVLHPSHDSALHHGLHAKLADNFRHITTHRIVLVASVLVFIVLVACGFLSDHHEHASELEAHEGESDFFEMLIPVTFILIASMSLAVMMFVSNHFLEDHIWHHVVGKHFLKIFLGTFLALAVLFAITNVWDIKAWVEQYSANKVYFLCLLAAILVGLIPISGPHWVFALLYFGGVMPFGALLANCIVQDGHGAIPLFAESKRDFIIVKIVKVLVALAAGIVVWWL